MLEKPKVSFWMVLIPILFVYFIYRMQTFKSGRMKFDEEFMTTRRRAMDAALDAVEASGRPDIDAVVRNAGLAEALKEPYAAWVECPRRALLGPAGRGRRQLRVPGPRDLPQTGPTTCSFSTG